MHFSFEMKNTGEKSTEAYRSNHASSVH